MSDDNQFDNSSDEAKALMYKALATTKEGRKILAKNLSQQKDKTSESVNNKVALSLIPILDAMMEDKKDRLFKKSDYPNIQKSTLKQRLFDGLKTILENHDPEGKYLSFRELFEVTEIPAGFKFRFVGGYSMVTGELKCHVVEEGEFEETQAEWKSDLYNYLEDDARWKAPYEYKGVISEEDKEMLQGMFGSNDHFAAVIEPNRLKVVKIV